MRPHVVYWNHSPTPYFVDRFNAIADRGNIDLEAWFNDVREPDRSWDVTPSEWRFRARFIPSRALLGWTARVPVAELLETRPDLLVQEYDRGHLFVGFLTGRKVAGRTAFRVLPNYDTWSDRTVWRELGKRWAFSAVDAAKVPGPDGASLAMRYGLDRRRIFPVTQTIDVDNYARAQDVDPDARVARRETLGLSGCVFVYVGRLWRGKGLDTLFDAFGRLREEGMDISLLVVGDGVDEPRYREAAASDPGRVAFAGFVQSRDLPELLAVADVMVFPTLGDPHGLVVEEGMAAGLPVISSDAAGDIALRIADGETGYRFPAGDAAILGEHMRSLARDQAAREVMASTAFERVQARRHERYAIDFERFVEGTLAVPRRRNVGSAIAAGAGHVIAWAGRRSRPASFVAEGGRPDEVSSESPYGMR